MTHKVNPVKQVLLYTALLMFAVMFLYPFLIQIATSFKGDVDAANNTLSLVPNPFDTTAWQRILGLGEAGQGAQIPRWTMNSVFITVIVTVCRVFFDSLAGYALARLRFAGRSAVFAALLAIMSVPGVALLIPKFLMVNYLGIYDTYTAMILPLIIDAAGIFIMKQFFDSVPVSIEEAARLDGAGVFRTFWSVVLPMAKPALITLTILSFQGSWNEFSHFLVVTKGTPDHMTLVTGLASMVGGGQGASTQYPFKLGTALLTTIPVAILFFSLQRYFIRGANEGGVKG